MGFGIQLSKPSFVDRITGFAETVKDKAADVTDTVLDGAGNIAGNVADRTGDVFESTISTLDTGADFVGERLRRGAGNTLGAVKDAVTGDSDGRDSDGRFSIREAGKNFVQGLASPITDMVSDPKKLAITAGMVAGGVALTVATGGAALPVLVAAGVTVGAAQAGKGVYDIATAEDADARERAFRGVGAGTATIGLSAVGAKGALKTGGPANTGGKSADSMGMAEALQQNFKAVPESVKASVDSFRDGSAVTRMQNLVTSKKPEVTVLDDFTAKNSEVGLVLNNGDSAPVIPKTSHGDMVAAVVREQHPKAQINKVDFRDKAAVDKLFQGEGGPDRFINISLAQPEDLPFTTASILESTPGLTASQLQRPNVRPAFDKLVQSALKQDEKNPFADALKLSDELVQGVDAQSAKGTSVFISGGNKPDLYNVLTLGGVNTNKVKAVGALNRDGSIAEYSANHAGIDEFALGTYSPRPVTGKNNRFEGVSITGKGKPGISAEELLSGDSTGGLGAVRGQDLSRVPRDIQGTSFAAPTLLTKTLNKEFPTLGPTHLFGGIQTENAFGEIAE